MHCSAFINYSALHNSSLLQGARAISNPNFQTFPIACDIKNPSNGQWSIRCVPCMYISITNKWSIAIMYSISYSIFSYTVPARIVTHKKTYMICNKNRKRKNICRCKFAKSFINNNLTNIHVPKIFFFKLLREKAKNCDIQMARLKPYGSNFAYEFKRQST